MASNAAWKRVSRSLDRPRALFKPGRCMTPQGIHRSEIFKPSSPSKYARRVVVPQSNPSSRARFEWLICHSILCCWPACGPFKPGFGLSGAVLQLEKAFPPRVRLSRSPFRLDLQPSLTASCDLNSCVKQESFQLTERIVAHIHPDSALGHEHREDCIFSSSSRCMLLQIRNQRLVLHQFPVGPCLASH